MPLVQQMGLVPAVVRHLSQYLPMLGEEDRMGGAAFLAFAIDTEAFETERNAFFEGDTKALLAQFPGLFLSDMTRTPEVRKKLRPLLDVVQRL